MNGFAAGSLPLTVLASGTASISISGTAATATSANAVSFNGGLTTGANVAFNELAINSGSNSTAWAAFNYSSGSPTYAVGVTGFGSAGNGMYFKPNNSSYTNIIFQNSSGSTVGSISGTGSATAFNTSSDRRIKENFSATSRGLEALRQIDVQDFNFLASPGARVQGLVAQNVYKVYPEAVTTNGDDGKSPLGNQRPWAVDYGRMTPLIIKSVQEVDRKLSALEKRVEALESNQ